jgi:Zn-dependent protease with chaperone function
MIVVCTTLFVVWLGLAPLFIERSLKGLRSDVESWKRFRKTIKRASLANLFFAGMMPGAAVALALSDDRGIQFILAGVTFFVCSAWFQWVLGAVTYPNLRRIGIITWDRSAYQFRLLMSQISLALPIAISAMVAGAVHSVVYQYPGRNLQIEYVVLLLCCLLWIVQWPAVRAASLPGTPANFPCEQLKRLAVDLAKSMGTELRDILLLRTSKAPFAGAFALGGHRIAITDHLLSALDDSQFLAVVAHESAHFGQRTKGIFAVAISMLAIAASIVPLSLLIEADTLGRSVGTALFLAVVFLAILPLVKLKQRNEDEADLLAAKYTSPIAVMEAIAITYALNHRLHDKQGTMVHKPLASRLSNIASHFGLDSARCEAAVKYADSVAGSGRMVCSAKPITWPSDHG